MCRLICAFVVSIWHKTCFLMIFNGCEVRIENSVTRVTVRHHQACRVMPNSYPEWRNFHFLPNSHYGFFFLHTRPSSTAFKLCYFVNFTLKYLHFWSRQVRFSFYLRRWRHDVWQKMTSKTYIMTSKLASWHQKNVLMSCTRIILHRGCKTTFPSSGQVQGNSGWVCKNNCSKISCKILENWFDKEYYWIGNLYRENCKKRKS